MTGQPTSPRSPDDTGFPLAVPFRPDAFAVKIRESHYESFETNFVSVGDLADRFVLDPIAAAVSSGLFVSAGGIGCYQLPFNTTRTS